MFLKRIELTGFKSFADKTELEFVQGVSAIVGPNGCGKSNISDAIRWVLGEQSAKSLRGGKMEDIIFAGSNSRKPVNYGEVSLTLDNSDEQLPLDFNEITVTRRIHRSGESEYFINKQACRLKDITELFMDTGIGKEAYSIIGQGRIEEILSTRSEDRRGIFEEASGIVKYKTRRKEAQKKLENTEQNLVRIQDLISELGDQIEPLREQSEKATQYKQLQEQLKSQEISLYVHQIEQLYASWKQEDERLKQLQQQQIELSTIVNQHDAYLEKHRLATQQLEQELEQLQQSLLSVSEEVEKCEGYGEVLKERQRNLEKNHAEQAVRVDNDEKKIAQIQQEKEEIEQKLAQVSTRLTELKARLQQEEQRLLEVSATATSEEEEQYKSELLETLNQAAQVRNELRYIDQQLEAFERRKLKLDDDHEKWIAEKQKLDEKKQQCKQQLQQTSEEIHHLRDEFLKQSERLQSKQHLLDEMQYQARKLEQTVNAMTSRRDTLRDLHNDYDGFAHGVREVLKAAKTANGLKGVHGAVAEIIKVPAKVELAIETALGPALQYIVMEDEKHSRQAIQFLKVNQRGRATFLPLNVIKGRSIDPQDWKQVQHEHGLVGVAADLIEVEKRYDAIIRNLLGNVLIAENLEQANRMAAICKYRYRVVTLDGDVVHAGGSMSGGSQQKNKISLLGRQRQIEEMDRQIAKVQAEWSDVQQKLQSLLKEIEELKQSIENLREQGEQKRLMEQQIRADLSKLESEAKVVDGHLRLYHEDVRELNIEQQELEQRKEKLNEDLDRCSRKETELHEAIRQAESQRLAKQSEKEQLQSQLTDLKVNIATVAQERQTLEEQIQQKSAELQTAQDECQRNRDLFMELSEDIQRNRVEQEQQIQRLEQLKKQKQDCTEQIEFKRAERARWMEQLEREESETKEQRMALKKVEEELHQCEVKVNRLDVELDHLLHKLGEDYEISFELAKQRYPVPEDIPAAQQMVRSLKREMAQLGEVNLGAIEEYRRVNERYQFLTQQKADLIEAKETLYQVIREMNEEMSKRFIDTFTKIRDQFTVTFTKLFGGGRADLILTEPDQLLETGIDIVAQPPGKKLQNLQLLSGGERALTAIALLFAILKVKPVPFCVLDEVEAALDEANVARFAQYLREFSHDTQFIVVTHRKGTMEAADVLYGVTMEDDGVSKLVSVRLEEDTAESA